MISFQDKESQAGMAAPRVLSIDDYFMVSDEVSILSSNPSITFNTFCLMFLDLFRQLPVSHKLFYKKNIPVEESLDAL